MTFSRRLATLALPFGVTLAIAGCSKANQPQDDSIAIERGDAKPVSTEAERASAIQNGSTPTAAKYLGKWDGADGSYVIIDAKKGDDVALDMRWDGDKIGAFDGTVTPRGISFIRAGKPLTLTPATGGATGVAALSGKQDCLMVAQGEAYCRG
jgi:hypothetical protein